MCVCVLVFSLNENDNFVNSKIMAKWSIFPHLKAIRIKSTTMDCRIVCITGSRMKKKHIQCYSRLPSCLYSSNAFARPSKSAAPCHPTPLLATLRFVPFHHVTADELQPTDRPCPLLFAMYLWSIQCFLPPKVSTLFWRSSIHFISRLFYVLHFWANQRRT